MGLIAEVQCVWAAAPRTGEPSVLQEENDRKPGAWPNALDTSRACQRAVSAP